MYKINFAMFDLIWRLCTNKIKCWSFLELIIDAERVAYNFVKTIVLCLENKNVYQNIFCNLIA